MPYRLLSLGLLLVALAAPRPATNDVVVQIQTVPLDTYRLADFDPIDPTKAPVVFTVTLINDDQERDLTLEVGVRAEDFGFLGTLRADLGPVMPNQVVTLTNREFDDYDIEEDGSRLVDVATERGVFPADVYSFSVRVLDTRGSEVTTDDDAVETSNPGAQLDLLGPGARFGEQDPELVASRFPVFQWFSSASAFNFALYEVLPGQTSPEAVIANRPIFEASDVTTATFPYPAAAEELTPGRTYAWQIQARLTGGQGLVLVPSEVFWFTVEQSDVSETTPGGDAAPSSFIAPLARLEVQPEEATLEPGGTAFFQMAAYDRNDLPLPNAEVTWSVVPATGGTIDSDGVFVAGSRTGPVAVAATSGSVQSYATVFIEAPEPPVAANTDASDDTLAVTLVQPFDGQELPTPTIGFAWSVRGTTQPDTLTYRVRLWQVPADAGGVPETEALWTRTTSATSLAYPFDAPELEDGAAYVVLVDALAGDALVARTEPARFSIRQEENVDQELARALEAAQADGTLDASTRVLAELRAYPLPTLLRQQLGDLGIEVELEDGPWLQLQVPFEHLLDLAALDGIRVLTPPAPHRSSAQTVAPVSPRPPAPPPATPAAAPVRVAVLEFGFDEAAIRALLPGHTITTRSFRADGELAGLSQAEARHGAAVVQALAEYLPSEAEVLLLNFDTELEFRQALAYAVEEGVRVLSCSVSWTNAYDHYDGTSYFAEQVGELLGENQVLVTAAGNFAQSHWEGTYVDDDGDGFHDFDGTNALRLDLAANTTYDVLLSWNDWTTPTVDLDLLFLDAAGRPVMDSRGRPLASRNRQGSDQFERPVERIAGFRPFLPGTQTYQLKIAGRDVAAASEQSQFELYLYPPPLETAPAAVTTSSLASGLPTVRSQSVVPVGGTAYVHSSEGPTNDGRIRPDFVADPTLRWDGTLWSGTSFAAPRIAGAYALIFAHHPDWDLQEATAFLKTFSAATDKTPSEGWGPVDVEALVRALTF